MEVTLLSREQLFSLEDIRIAGRCAASDFALLLGCDNYSCFVKGLFDYKSMPGPSGWCLSSSHHREDSGVGVAVVSDSIGSSTHIVGHWPTVRSGGIRPCIPLSTLPHGTLSSSKYIKLPWDGFDTDFISLEEYCRYRSGLEGDSKKPLFEVVEFGEYPQKVAVKEIQKKLDEEYYAGRLRKTGKTYTTDSVTSGHLKDPTDDFSLEDVPFYSEEKFTPIEHEEYEYNGSRYVRVKANCDDYIHRPSLSTGMYPITGSYYWVEVSPITWIIDRKLGMLISMDVLASGVRFGDDYEYDGHFKKSEMYYFLNVYFAKDMMPSRTYKKTMEDKSESFEKPKILK